MELQEVIDKCLFLLERNKDEWEDRYVNYAHSIIQKNSESGKGTFRVRKPLCAYSKVSESQNKDWRYDLRFAGQSIGEIRVRRDDKVSLFVSDKKKQSNKKFFGIDTPSGEFDWNSGEAKQFRIYFKRHFEACARIATKSREHQVESLLLNEFAKTLRKQNKLLCNIQPIRLFGAFFQMPTPIKASGHDPEYARHAGGGIDILARTIHHNGEKRLCIIEVKDENLKKEPQSAAMLQAATYATFIARLLRSKGGKEWWNIFGYSQTPDAELHIDVVTLMPKATAADTKELIGSFGLHPLHTVLHCHSLYYDASQLAESLENIQTRKNPAFIFSGTFVETLKP